MTLAEQAKKAGMSDEEIETLKAGEAELSGAGDEPEVEAVADAAPAVTEDAAPAVEAVADEPVTQTMQVPALPENADARLAEIKAELKAATKKAFDGEMTADEYSDLQDKLGAERETILDAKKSAEFAQRYNEQMTQQFVAQTRGEAFKAYRAEGVDYADKANHQRFDRAFAVLMADPENAGKSLNELRSVYDEAHKMVKAMIGFVPAAKPAAAKTDTAAPRQVPTTLGGLPSAAPTSIQDETFQKMQTLDGEDLERFYASLPKAEVNRLMRLAS